MKTFTDESVCSMFKMWKACFLSALAAAVLSAPPGVPAQLAITEVMPNASRHTNGFNYPDFWELTNFGTNIMELTSYKFTDASDLPSARSEAFAGLMIAPGESIIFVREDASWFTNAAQFREWWGLTNAALQIRVVPRPFFPGLGFTDEIKLWDSDNVLIDRIQWDQFTEGYSFTYSSETGEMPTVSEAGVCNAMVALGSGVDVGSPGANCGPVELRFDDEDEPEDVTVDGGGVATFTARGLGFPRPRHQWFFNGELISSGTGSVLSLSSVTPANAGTYYAVLTNGLRSVTSRVATLTVNTNPNACELVTGPSDLTVTPGETPTLSVVTRGYPVCAYQWYFNGVEIIGATSSTLQVGPVSFGDAGVYSVIASNVLGTCSAAATLTVRRKPRLYITEVMAWPSRGHEDWFEVTNYDTNAVRLLDYRIDDTDGTFGGAFPITDDISLMPGESMIFVQTMEPEAFRQWWGAENLLAGLKIFRFTRFSLSESADELTLWNGTTTIEHDYIDTITYAFAVSNVTFWFAAQPLRFQEESVVGTSGAFCAAKGGDIGSPGYTTNPPPRITAIQRTGNDTIIRWRAPAGTLVRLEAKDTLAPGLWTLIGSFTATCQIMTTTNSTTGRQRFYRLAHGP